MNHSLQTKSSDEGAGGLIRKRAKPNPWFEIAAEKLRQIGALPANWDSYGARRPGSLPLAYANALLHLLRDVVGVSEPYLTPHPNGHICLEWDGDDRTLTVEIDAKGQCHFYYERGEVEEQGVGNFGRIQDLVTKL